MKYIGAHVSTEGGVALAPRNAAALGARAFALFTKNQRQWQAGPLSDVSIAAFAENCAAAGIAPRYILPHAGYLINLGNPDRPAREKSFDAFIDELRRCEALGLLYLNLHPGSSLGKIGDRECLNQIAAAINSAHEKTATVTVLLENTAGQGSWVGWRFEHLAEIIAAVKNKARVGVCLDTAHAYAAGYDVTTPAAYQKTVAEFDTVVGLSYVKGMHLNDSKAALGSRVDRHENLGRGLLGLGPFKSIMNDPRFNDLPLILETIDDTLWKKEIGLLYKMGKPAERQ
ncbi:MAG: deoxyribonuclease IV [Chitinivibrionales bacterium]|nr:deoxyribonuclease IV [Chitinivibrionales bacterium]